MIPNLCHALSSRVLLICVLVVSLPSAAYAERTIVLVHGSFVGGWYWDPVVRQLEELGHPAIAVGVCFGSVQNDTYSEFLSILFDFLCTFECEMRNERRQGR